MDTGLIEPGADVRRDEASPGLGNPRCRSVPVSTDSTPNNPNLAPMTKPIPSAEGQPSLDRRTMLRRLSGTAVTVWAAPSVLGISKAGAMGLSGCVDTFDFDDATLQGWSANGSGQASWQVSSLQSNSGTHSAYFGNPSRSNSLHPIVGAPSYSSGRSSGTITSPSTTVAATDMVAFDVRLAIENSAAYDRFKMYILQGATRVQIWDKSQGGFTVINHPQSPGAPWDLFTTFGAWTTQTVTIGNPSGINLANPVQFEFDFQTVDASYNRTEGIFLDNIMLPCAAAALTVSARADSSGFDSGVNDGASLSGYQPGYVPPPTASAPEDRPPPPE